MKQTEGIKNSLRTLAEEHWRTIHIAGIILSVLVVYANSLDVPLVMDDAALLSIGPQNLLDILLHGEPRRITDFTFALNYLLHDTDVIGYHLVNLALHLCASITLYLFVGSSISALRLSFPPKTDSGGKLHFYEHFVPFSAALLFAVHPIQTQAVTYIIQRYTSMATFFYLLSALLYIRARIVFESSRTSPRTLLIGSAALLSGIMAIGSKQIAFTLPIMLFILEIFIFKGRLITRRFFITSGVFALAAIGFILLNRHDIHLKDILFDLHHATSEDSHASRTAYFLTQSRVVVTYLRLLCLPVNQSILYDYPLHTNPLSLPVVASLSLHVILFSVMAFLFRQSQQGLNNDDLEKGTLQRLMALSIAWFYIALAVESSIFPIRDIIFEHRIYLPSVGFFLAASAGIAMVANGKHTGINMAWSLLIIATLLLGGMTVARNRTWGDSLRLWQDTVAKAPNHHLAHSNLAFEYLVRNRPDMAIPLFVRALELRPELVAFKIKVYFGEALQETNLIDGWRFTTGQEYLLPDGGSSSYKSTSVMFNNLGLAYEYLGAPEKAVVSYKKSLRVDQGYDLAWYNLGLLAARTGDREQAIKSLKRLEQLNSQLAGLLSSRIP